jgi:hypothetical protein
MSNSKANGQQKEAELLLALNELTDFHATQGKLYADFIDSIFPSRRASRLEEVPYLPVRVFKSADLKSVDESQVRVRMSSSGTSGLRKSKIAIDSETSKLQSRALAHNFSTMLGKTRRPMLAISPVLASEDFTAQQAAINGFATLCSGTTYALKADGTLDLEVIMEFLTKNSSEQFLVFGFTFQLWQFFQQVKNAGIKLNFSNATILHGGGWKKLESLRVSDLIFRETASEVVECKDVRNYYGMIEQTGSIYFECKEGSLHAPSEGGAIIRHPVTLEAQPLGAEGLIQVFSTIQRSYPGHSLLTEDVGIVGEYGSCSCKHLSSTLKVIGRVSNAEIRGCSDAVS